MNRNIILLSVLALFLIGSRVQNSGLSLVGYKGVTGKLTTLKRIKADWTKHNDKLKVALLKEGKLEEVLELL